MKKGNDKGKNELKKQKINTCPRNGFGREFATLTKPPIHLITTLSQVNIRYGFKHNIPTKPNLSTDYSTFLDVANVEQQLILNTPIARPAIHP